MKWLGRYISRVLGRNISIGFGSLFPDCISDIAVSWFKDFNSTVIEDDTFEYVKDSIGDRTDTVFYGQYLDATSGQINFYRTSGTFDYTDPSDGSLVEGVNIPSDGLYTIPVNGICEIGINPKTNTSIDGLLDFDGVDDYVGLASAVDVTGIKTISFKMYLKSSFIGSNGGVCMLFDDGGDDILYIDYPKDPDQIRIVCSGTGATSTSATSIDVTSLKDIILEFEISKNGKSLTSVTVNDIAVTSFYASSYGGAAGYTIGSNISFCAGFYIWDVNINDEHAWAGYPAGNTDTAWKDTIGSIDGTVNGTPTTGYILEDSEEEVKYTSYYPVCERAGTVLHDVMENPEHISVDTPVWAESLYGSDYLNQYGYVDKQDFFDAGYSWSTLVDGSLVSLNDNTLVPLIETPPINQFSSTGLLDSDDVELNDSDNVALNVITII